MAQLYAGTTSWAQPAQGVLSALRSVGNTTTKAVTLDLDEPIVLDMASGGAVVAVIADRAYDLGVAMADAAALGLLGEKVDPFIVVDAVTVTKDNIVQGYQDSYREDPPQTVLDAIN